MSYAVVWSEDGSPVYAGRLDVLADGLQLVGRGGPQASRRSVRYRELTAVRIERTGPARLRGAPTLVLQRREAAPIRIASVEGVGTFPELAERVSAAREQAVA